jgi:Fur family transcriptional regulator, ferric uptake regulator
MKAHHHRSTTKGSHDVAAAKVRLAAHAARTGLKHSRARDVVVDAFLATEGHVSVDELTAKVRGEAPAIGYSTVYRALKLLVECGVAAVREFGDGRSRFERVVDGTHHDHLICTECGEIAEFEEPSIEELQREVARRYGFEVVSHRMELYGKCPGCRRH